MTVECSYFWLRIRIFLAVLARSNLVYLESGPNVYCECVQHWYILTIFVSVVLSMPHAIRMFLMNIVQVDEVVFGL